MNRLRALRKEHNLKQSDLSNKLGVTQASLSGWETGKYEIDNKTLIALSNFFGVSVDYLLGNDTAFESSPPPSLFGERIKELRKSHRLTMKKLGELIGVAQNTVSNWENGKRQPDYGTLTFLAEYFNVSTDYLLGKDATTERPSTTPSIFGERLKNLRLEKGLSQREIAEHLGLTQQAYAYYETGDREPGLKTLLALSSILNVSTDYLLGIETLPAPQLSENEQYLIDKFRKLPWKSQNHILQTADILSEK